MIIDSFRDFAGTIEIIGLGGIRPPVGGAQEAEISVLVQSNAETPGVGAGVRILHIGCGQLDLLVAGSRWRKGSFVGNAQAERIAAVFEFARDETIGRGVDPPPAGLAPFPSQAISSASGFLLRRHFEDGRSPVGTTSASGPGFVLLPQMELIRGLFGVSSGFLIELFDGIRNPAVSSERGLVSRALSCLLDDGTVRLVAGRNLSRDEALIAAAVIADPAMRRFHDSAFQQLSVSKEWKQGRPTYLNLKWPWSVPIRFEMEGRWIERVGDRRRFIVTRISAIGMPLPFHRIEVYHPGTMGPQRDDLPPPQGRLRPTNARIVVITTGRAATASRRPVEIGTGRVDFSALQDVEIETFARGGLSRMDCGGIGEDSRGEAPFGTGGRQPGADIQVGLAILRRKLVRSADAPPRSLAQALDTTWMALSRCCQNGRWELDALPRSNSASRTLPYGGLDLPREPLVARVLARNKRILIVDRGSPAGDECSLGILVPKTTSLSDRALAIAARQACELVGGRWRSPRLDAPQFYVTSINRASEVWGDVRAYADLLGRRIASVLAE